MVEPDQRLSYPKITNTVKIQESLPEGWLHSPGKRQSSTGLLRDRRDVAKLFLPGIC